MGNRQPFALMPLLLVAACLSLPAALRPCTPTGAVLTYSDDDQGAFYLNGNLLGACQTNNCWSMVNSVTLTAAELGALSPTGDNILAVFCTDTSGNVSGVTWDLVINYADCPAQDVQSNGACTLVDYVWNTLSGGQTFPAGWTTPGFIDGGWSAPYWQILTPGQNSWNVLSSTAGAQVPWIWGNSTFSANPAGLRRATQLRIASD